ncbi:MAG: hypothetical protein H7Y04_02040 [Verrucomicrobia bacterium]|nr:hypothetical protein [Cytophagales bacterium]
MEKEFKYSTEEFIVMYLSKYQILQQQELDFFIKNQNVFDERNQCHIYFILKRPRTTINLSYFTFTDHYFEIEINIQIQNSFTKRLLKIKNSDKSKRAKLISEYPNNYFTIVIDNQDLFFKVGALLDIAQHTEAMEDPILDYEVLYIGQSYGDDGNRNATDRLLSHSTLQNIYNEAIIKNPDSEIWLMLSSFSQKNISSLNGRVKVKEENEDTDAKRFVNFVNMEFTEKQKINFTEAALIRTFQPKFNKDYKDNFPNPAHSSYSECYELDLNGIVVEMDMSDISRWLYSKDRPRGENNENLRYWQHGKFHFIDDNERYKMFNNEYL